MTRSDRVETSIRTRVLLLAGFLVGVDDTNRVILRQQADWGEGRRLAGKTGLHGNLELFGLTINWIIAARKANTWLDDMVEVGAETIMETKLFERLSMINIRHARREEKRRKTRPKILQIGCLGGRGGDGFD